MELFLLFLGYKEIRNVNTFCKQQNVIEMEVLFLVSLFLSLSLSVSLYSSSGA